MYSTRAAFLLERHTDGSYVARCEQVRAVYGQGETPEAAILKLCGLLRSASEYWRAKGQEPAFDFGPDPKERDRLLRLESFPTSEIEIREGNRTRKVKVRDLGRGEYKGADARFFRAEGETVDGHRFVAGIPDGPPQRGSDGRDVFRLELVRQADLPSSVRQALLGRSAASRGVPPANLLHDEWFFEFPRQRFKVVRSWTLGMDVAEVEAFLVGTELVEPGVYLRFFRLVAGSSSTVSFFRINTAFPVWQEERGHWWADRIAFDDLPPRIQADIESRIPRLGEGDDDAV